jgi:hypothetical protein
MTNVGIWAATGGHEKGGHGLACVAACFDLKRNGLVKLSSDRWMLTNLGRSATVTAVELTHGA